MRKSLFFLLSFILANGHLLGQQAKQYVFSRYNTVNGLASNYVNNLVQDKKGFIWLATINGLQRYDGHRFITYKHKTDNPSTPPTDNIAAVFEDRYNNLWLSTADNKLGIFDTEKNLYREVAVVPKIRSTINVSKKLFETSDGRLLLFVPSEGIFTYDLSSESFVKHNELISVPAGWKYLDIKEDVSIKKFWIACDSGLVLYDPSNKHLSYRGNNVDNDPIIKQLGEERSLININVDDPARFVMATWGPLAAEPDMIFYDRTNDIKQHYSFSKEFVRGYHEYIGSLRQRNGRQWFYGRPFIAEYKGAGQQAFEAVNNEYRDEQSINFEQVNYMYEDHEQNLWVCSDNGVFIFNPDYQMFYTYNLERPGDKEATQGPTQSVLHLQNGHYWVGTWGRGLYCYDKDFKPVAAPESLRKVESSWSIWCMIQQKDTGLIWMGLQGGSILVYNTIDGSSRVLWPEPFQGRTVRQVTEDQEGNLWFGSHGGHIIKWDRKLANGDPEKGYQLITKAIRVLKMITDKSGYVWVATFGKGLYRINPANNTIVNFNKNGPPGQRLSEDGPSDILQYNDTTLLVANGAVDIINTKTNKITAVNTDDGLPSNDVQCLQRDKAGMVWLGMISGLTRMSLEKKIFILYDRRDGIRYDIFNVGGAFVLPDSRLFFTTDHNFVIFDPEKMVQRDPPPDVKILDFKMANTSLAVDSILRLNKIQLGYNKNSIAISFGTLSYLRNNKKVFYYQLEKIDAGWILADDRHQAIYNYLPPGSYNFKVRCVNGYGIPSVHVTRLVINIESPFWKTWWFYSIILLAGMAVLYWVDKERLRRLFTLQQLRTQIADNLHKDINTTLNNIHLLSEIAKIKADKDIIKSKEYIDQINTKSRRMINDMDDMLWSINPQNDSMHKTLERMSEFAEGIKNNNDCKIDLIVDEKVKSLKLDMRMRHEIFYIFKEALANVLHHSNCTESIINIDLIKSNLLIQIHDNGSGLEIKSLQNSTEIKEMQKRAKLLNALLDIQTDKKGTKVILQVPV